MTEKLVNPTDGAEGKTVAGATEEKRAGAEEGNEAQRPTAAVEVGRGFVPQESPEERKIIHRFFSNWRPLKEAANPGLTRQILEVLAPVKIAVRQTRFAEANHLYKVHRLYREKGIFREGKNERAEQFGRLFHLPMPKLAKALEQGEAAEYLTLIQFCFEFGRHTLPPKHGVARELVLELFRLTIKGPSMKYSLYPNHVVYTAGGRSHDELARLFVELGLGGGLPRAGGLIVRMADMDFEYDLSSTAFGRIDPALVRQTLARNIRMTGGDEEKTRFRLATDKLG